MVDQLEYKPTVDAMIATLQCMGVDGETLLGDADFVKMLFDDLLDREHGDVRLLRPMLDLAYLGILTHRRMQFEGDDGNLFTPDFGATNYSATFAALATSFEQQLSVPKVLLFKALAEAGARAIRLFRSPDTDERTADLHKDAMVLCAIGLIVHRHLPRTDTPPL